METLIQVCIDVGNKFINEFFPGEFSEFEFGLDMPESDHQISSELPFAPCANPCDDNYDINNFDTSFCDVWNTTWDYTGSMPYSI